MNSSQADQAAENIEGLTIQLDESLYQQEKQIHIKGVFGTFVNCGSQYAIWGQFPQTIRYSVKDLDSGIIYLSIDRELSISWNGNSVYERYSAEHCNKIVIKNFTENINDIYFINPSKEPINNYEINAENFSKKSNVIRIQDKPVLLKGF